jgi:hypothetical protein
LKKGDRLSETMIVRAVADDAARRVTGKVIAALQRMRITLSGDDSELKTTWGEICVQVQYEHSFFWDAYEETVKTLIEAHVAELQKYEREAIWLQTPAGSDWDCEETAEREAYPVVNDEIVDYLADEYVYAGAGEWSNARIRAYIDRSSRRD